MKNSRTAKIAIWAVVLYFSFAGFCQTIQAQSEISFRLVQDTVIVASLRADDQGPFDFLIDTGTDTSVVDPSVARLLGLPALGTVQLNTFAGPRTVIQSSLHCLSSGSLRVTNVEVLEQDLGELRKLDSHIQGIVGQNFLSQFNYLLDYRKRTIRVEADQEFEGAVEGTPVAMERRENMMIVSSEARSKGIAELRLLIDSGANTIVLTRRPVQGLERGNTQTWAESNAAGQQGMEVGRVRVLTVGSQKLTNVAVALPGAQEADRERVEDGVLPMAMFKTVYVNNRKGFVVFNPQLRRK